MSRRTALIWATLALAAGCNSMLGIEEGSPRPEGSSGADSGAAGQGGAAPDASAGGAAGIGGSAGEAGSGGLAGGAGTSTGGAAGTGGVGGGTGGMSGTGGIGGASGTGGAGTGGTDEFDASAGSGGFDAAAGAGGGGVDADSIEWMAGRDLMSLEESAGAGDNPNTVTPEWSYGWRQNAADTWLTLADSSQHCQACGGVAGLNGYSAGSNGPSVMVNMTGAPLVYATGKLPIGPDEMYLHPANDPLNPVVRWTTPTAGDYRIQATWRDLDDACGNGATAHIMINGTGVFSQVFSNASKTADFQQSLDAGDVVDFVMDSNSQWGCDGTGFNATITAL